VIKPALEGAKRFRERAEQPDAALARGARWAQANERHVCLGRPMRLGLRVDTGHPVREPHAVEPICGRQLVKPPGHSRVTEALA